MSRATRLVALSAAGLLAGSAVTTAAHATTTAPQPSEAPPTVMCEYAAMDDDRMRFHALDDITYATATVQQIDHDPITLHLDPDTDFFELDTGWSGDQLDQAEILLHQDAGETAICEMRQAGPDSELREDQDTGDQDSGDQQPEPTTPTPTPEPEPEPSPPLSPTPDPTTSPQPTASQPPLTSAPAESEPVGNAPRPSPTTTSGLPEPPATDAAADPGAPTTQPSPEPTAQPEPTATGPRIILDYPVNPRYLLPELLGLNSQYGSGLVMPHPRGAHQPAPELETLPPISEEELKALKARISGPDAGQTTDSAAAPQADDSESSDRDGGLWWIPVSLAALAAISATAWWLIVRRQRQH